MMFAFLATLSFIDGFFLFLFSLNLLILIVLALWNKSKSELREEPLHDFPRVTVQVPLYNERYVAERIIHAVCALEYPKDRLQIQILDDSTDETLETTQKTALGYSSLGFDIKILHREKRTGYKGGALREGLEKAAGLYIAIFDADFVPPPDFLKKVVPYLEGNPDLGMVQARWGHLNSGHSLLTRAQTIMIDCHFSIDQTARSGSALLMNFNGTAGIWRKECILDAGNWQDDTVTEDLDLSYRAELKGWKMQYIRDLVIPAELPVQLGGYKSQQYRWAKGSIQTAKKLLFRVFKADLNIFQKYQAFMHLLYYTVHPLLVLNILLTLPLLHLGRNQLPTLPLQSGIAVLFAFGFVFTILVLISSQILVSRRWMLRLTWLPPAMLVGLGLAVNNTIAVLDGLFGRSVQFIRTPKWGTEAAEFRNIRKGYFSPDSPAVTILEACMGGYCLFSVILSATLGRYAIIPYYGFYSLAFFYTFFLGLHQRIRFSKKLVHA